MIDTKILKTKIKEAGYKQSVILKDGKANLLKLEKKDGSGGVIIFKNLNDLEDWLNNKGIDKEAQIASQNYRKSDYIQFC